MAMGGKRAGALLETGILEAGNEKGTGLLRSLVRFGFS